MNRRGFFSALTTTVAGMAAAFTLDPEDLLWKPNEKKIFIPNMTYVEHAAIVANNHIHDRDCLFIRHWHMMNDLGIDGLQTGWHSEVRRATPAEFDAVRAIDNLNPKFPECHSKAKDLNGMLINPGYTAQCFADIGVVIPGFPYNPAEKKA